MRISDWSSDVCSSDLHHASIALQKKLHARGWGAPSWPREYGGCEWSAVQRYLFARERLAAGAPPPPLGIHMIGPAIIRFGTRSEEHTSELQSLMRISYAVFCLKKNTKRLQQEQAHKDNDNIS